ncbi:MAG TPA: putative sulfate exporter family transporter, partial [Planctomycetaceae bacterium]
GHRVGRFAAGFVAVFLLALLAFVLTGQKVVEHYNLEYALWALLVGLLISNTVGTPALLRPAARTEFYIKTGLVLLGAEVLFNKLLALGVPGIFVSWVVTPVVLIGTYLFGQYVLKIRSRSLNMVISADMSVCGVSAAIATAAACKAKKEELSLAIGLSLTFTVVMMVVMPAVIKAVGMNDVLAGAWLGGTIDSTGAVAAAGGMLGDAALTAATTVKMIQNILIGVVAFGVAVYWVTYVERTPDAPRPGVGEIWRRFPKFVLGFVAASLVFSWIYASGTVGEAVVDATIGSTKSLRGWFFCLAFVSIGLETNFRELSHQMTGGKPLVLYLCGQALNLCLTLAMAYLMFEVVFPDAAATLAK